ncbi:HAMP domain-containing sensor histidine kinase [Phytohabitans sp. ZYX-F-186]|uniref:histidine kinase n=1 Tax=Phytohabitans maris TaxID=3071409 RepID=A0ABU0ZNV9_9ACTN|nr:HAMP domain-containing sensor histidine kinase [Phytohabitans sp. ZYX-F-186]MDQ7907612.1 HAMP domain-containing sensor histidine kinase [Phytohabitans sp. ZYX-F-186]
MRRPGLRTRVAAAFAAGAFALSASMAALSYELTERALMAGRERSALRSAYLDAGVVHAGLATERPDVSAVLSTLNTGNTRRALLHRDGRWYARAADAGLTDAIPPALQGMVEQGKLSKQRVHTDSGPAVVVGVPLPSNSGFYVIDSMRELDQTLRTLALVLTLVAAGTTAAGAGFGWYLTRRVLRPLDTVTAAAREITAGDLNARLDPATEPDLERLTTSFNEMVDQLSARLERDRRFAADVSHELRSPLQTLSAATSVLDRHRPQLGGRAATAVTLLSEEVDRFQRLVADLLELARDDQPIQRTPVDVAAMAREECRARGLPEQVVRVAEGSTARWSVDRRRFIQILGNLLDNADRHGGGATAVSLSQMPDAFVLEVDDEGPGVRPEDREAIFDRFVRGRAASARGDSDGTGLGLALVARHASAHGGRVSVTDRPGGGARFRVELPRANP